MKIIIPVLIIFFSFNPLNTRAFHGDGPPADHTSSFFYNHPVTALAPPSNDDPCNAVVLTVGSSCNFATYTNTEATATTGVTDPPCASYSGGDVWFSVTVPAGGSLIFNSQAGDITDGGMAIYTGTCNALTEIACNDDMTGLMPSITAGGLSPGSTIWIRFWAYGGSVSGEFDICVTTPPPPPANDNPCNAISLTVSPTCNYTTYTNAAATPAITVPDPSCGFYNNAGDVWFSVTVPAAGALLFDTQAGTMTNGEIAIYTGTCNGLTELACDADGSFNPQMGSITAGGLAPGSTIWIRVWDYGGFSPGSFGICVTPPPPPPANDNPCNAIPLPVNNTCIYSTHTNTGATNSVSVPSPGCGAFTGDDVWFTVTVPSVGGIFLNSVAGTMLDGAMAVYTGSSCNNLTLIRCDDNSSSNLSMPLINMAGLTPGTTLWIRFWGYGGFYAGTFDICASIPPPPTVQDCPAAIPICQNIYTESVSYSGTGNILNEIDNGISCLGSGEKNDVWYTFTVQTSGDLNFTITPNNFTEDYDWAVYNLTNATCADIYSNSSIDVSCNFSVTGGYTGPTGGTTLTSQDASGTPINDVIPVLAGETYVINVSNFSSSANGYTIDFTASTASIFDNVKPVFQSISAASACGGSQLTVNFSENILCNTVQNADFAVTGPGGPYTITGWSSASCSSGATYGNNITLTISPAIVTNGAFQVCLTNISGSVADLCGNIADPGCFDFDIATTIPAFAAIAPICSGSTAPVLPSTSTNGVTGTWSPATVSNTATGTYTFTPGSGQCAVPVTLTVTVTPAGTAPVFNPIPPICSGSTAPVLPVVSVNGITGSWSPSTVNNTTSGIYTFTPAAGQCAVSTTLSITVNSTFTSTTDITICNSQLPYSWNGNNYPAAGTYAVTLTSSTGCDSVATLNLAVNNAVNSTTNTTICNNQLPYSWNGNNYPAAGTYSVTLTSSSGCDSVATLNLVVNNAVTSTTNTTICNNQLPYSWNGNNYPAAGNYSVTLTSSSGCDSVATLNLAVNNAVTSTTNTTICNTQLPYSWNGNNYPAAGTYSITLTSSTGCDSVATLNLVVNNAVTSTTNTTICNNQLPYSWNGNNYPAAGTYSVTLVSSTGCDSVATLNLVVNNAVTSTTNTTICNNQLPYSWNGNNYPAAGTYSVTLTNSSGCDSVATLNLVVNNAVTSTTNTTICNNQLPYSWNGNNYPAAGTYSVTLTSSSGCDSVATLNLVVNNAVTSTTNTTICNNQLPYSWNGNNYPAAGTYSVTLTGSSGCDSVATLNLVVNNAVISTTNTTICNNQLPYSWNGNNYAAAGTYSVTLTSSSGCDSVATLNLVVNNAVTSTTNTTICNNQLPYSWNGNNYPGAGTYSVTLTSSSGCDSVATLNLVVNNAVTSTTNTTICNNQLPYSWNGNNYPGAGTYSVTLTSSSGCDSVATLNLVVNNAVTSTTNTTICNNQLPYSWNGNNYPAAGTYSVTLTGSSGCDSVATLNLVVNNVVTSTTNITICNNQLPYNWNGNNYPAAGTYSVTLTSSSGCDSVATLNLAANSIVTSTSNITICNSQLPYSWNGNNYPAAGNYSVTLTSSAGCDSVATLNLTVNSFVTSTSNITICNSQLPYSWNGNNYPAAGNYSITLISSSGCDSIATLNLIVNNAAASTTNITICTSELPFTWNGNSYPVAGTYTVTLTSGAGCDSVATLNLAANPVLTSITNITICNTQLPFSWNGNSYSLAGTYSVTLISSNGCDSIATLNLATNAVVSSTTNTVICSDELPYSWNGSSYPSAGTYSITLTGSGGCDSIATLNLAVNPVVTSTTSVSLCSAQLPYSWNGQNYTVAGVYNVILSSTSGCDSIATLNLLVNPTPGTPSVGPGTVYCQYETSSPLAADVTTAGNHLVWYPSATGGTGSSTAPVPATSVPGTTQYYVSQANGFCEGPRVPITVTVNSKPALGADRALRICSGKTANLNILYNTTGNQTDWTMGQQPVTDPAAVNIAGLYQIITTGSSGCRDTALVNLAINPPVIANAGNDADVEYNFPHQLSGSGGLHYQWAPGFPILNNSHIANPVATLTDDQLFVLIVKDDIGCTANDTVKLRVLKGPSFYVPTAFTPNGDGLNDLFGPTTVGMKTLDFFRIFNRYGELIFETRDLFKKWDGTFKGKKQDIGNYAWYLRGTDRKGVVKTMKGNVMLIR